MHSLLIKSMTMLRSWRVKLNTILKSNFLHASNDRRLSSLIAERKAKNCLDTIANPPHWV